MLSPAQLEVRFIDYGNIEKQDLCNLRPFKREFMQLKAQGVHCALKGISVRIALWYLFLSGLQYSLPDADRNINNFAKKKKFILL